MKFITVLLFTFCASVSYGQDTSRLRSREDSIQLLVEKISEHNYLTGLLAGEIMGLIRAQYERFVYLLTLVTNEELVYLVNNSKGCTRIYAFIGLYHNKYDQLEQVKQQLNSDTSQVRTANVGTTEEGGVIRYYTVAYAINHIDKWYVKDWTDQIFTAFRNSDFDEKTKIFEHLLCEID